MKILCVGGEYYPDLLKALPNNASKMLKKKIKNYKLINLKICLLYTSPRPRD